MNGRDIKTKGCQAYPPSIRTISTSQLSTQREQKQKSAKVIHYCTSDFFKQVKLLHMSSLVFLFYKCIQFADMFSSIQFLFIQPFIGAFKRRMPFENHSLFIYIQPFPQSVKTNSWSISVLMYQ